MMGTKGEKKMEEIKGTRIEKLLALCEMTKRGSDAEAEEIRRVAMAMQVGYEIGKEKAATA